MKTTSLAFLASLAAAPLVAQDTRKMDAHVHGVSTLEIAIEVGIVEMNLTSPGMDIVGFEYEASTDADKDAVEAAIRVMLTPENIVTLPEAAECRLTEVLARDHAGGNDHAGEAMDHSHDDHSKDKDHAQGDGEKHNEFHLRYIFACEHPEDLTTIGLPFFDQFPNAQEIEAQYVTDTGAGSAEIPREAGKLTLN